MAQITIIGLGVIGNSLGLALRRYSQSAEGQASPFTIVGFDSALEMQQAAQRIGSIDRTSWDLPTAVSEANFVIIATPTMEVREVLTEIAPHLRDKAIVSDTASNKEIVLRWAQEILPANVSFVGGHPVARRAPTRLVSGDIVQDELPDADYFKGSPYCIMPLPTATEAAVNQVIGLASLLGAQPYFMDPAEHDSFVAAVEHLPALTAAVLMRLASTAPTSRDLTALAGGAFTDVTRMAAADPLTTRDALMANREHLLRWIDSFVAELHTFRRLVDDSGQNEKSAQALQANLEQARDAHKAWARPLSLNPEVEAQVAVMEEVGQRRLGRTFFGSLFSGRGKDQDGDKDKRR